MSPRFIKTVTLLACALCSNMALADPPALVGRVSLVQGQVGIRSDVGDGAGAAQLNWPVTSHNQITTARGARTEIRIGSSAIRLDAESSLEVSELDDDSLHLYLNYGSASVRIVNPEVLPGFALSTPNGRIRLQQPGRLRVDAARASTALTVFDGVALAEDRGSQLIVRAGKRAEIGDDDVRTGVALSDSFDDWAQQRDLLDERSTSSARYVTREMTGVEALDQNGVWRDDAEYGPLWLPSAVGPGWAPYRDGSWTWIAPWGWTWVDNAPWGYAPFHYGRWVQVEQRWAWAPGRQVGRPVWAPALVGWVGGAGWNLSFAGRGQRPLPAQGWYPLAQRDAFVPGYRLSQEHLQRINRDARPDGRGDGRGDGVRGDGVRRDGRGEHARDGLTVMPHAQFGQRGTIAVRNAPQAVVPPLALRNAPSAAPSAPFMPQGAGRDRDGRAERFERSERDGQSERSERDAMQRNRQPRPELNVVPAPAPRAPLMNPAIMSGQPQPQPQPQSPAPYPAFRPPLMNPAIITGQPQAPATSPSTSPPPFSRRDGRPGFDDGERRQQPAPVQGAVITAPTVVPAPAAAPPVANPPQFGRRDGRPAFEERALRQPAPVAAPPAMAAPMTPQMAAPHPAAEPAQPGRAMRNDGERRMREPDAGAAMPAQPPRQFAPAPVLHQQPAPVFQQQPAPVLQQQPAPTQAPAPVMMRQAPLAAPPPMPAPAQPMMVRQPAPAATQQGAPSERKNNPGVERKRAIDAER